MISTELTPAAEPAFYFVGVTTGKSSIMKVFPAWARHLGISECIRGIDCKWHDDPEVYRTVVDFLKHDELSLGALVTTHKLDLLKASRDRFEWLDPYATQLEEVSSISKRDGQLRGHAKDPISSGLSFDAIKPGSYWGETGAELCLLGAGGSSLALTIHLMKQEEGKRPSKIYVTNRSEKRLNEMKEVHSKMDCPIPVEYFLCPTPEQNDAVVAKLKEGSMVINATGLGKDAPGSPLTNAVSFPVNGIAWDFNYRGDLIFMDQARAQQEAKNLQIEDGWVYFVHGWLCVIEEVFNLDIPSSGPEFDRLCDIAAEARK
ncbi:MAG: shikimate dehydrogenase [Kiritimatiellia bacterium]|jgi:shikimate 5-dehydrogenase|nr:shikimate dehydrogenase [Kiritimatiellia bacterium]